MHVVQINLCSSYGWSVKINKNYNLTKFYNLFCLKEGATVKFYKIVIRVITNKMDNCMLSDFLKFCFTRVWKCLFSLKKNKMWFLRNNLILFLQAWQAFIYFLFIKVKTKLCLPSTHTIKLKMNGWCIIYSRNFCSNKEMQMIRFKVD